MAELLGELFPFRRANERSGAKIGWGKRVVFGAIAEGQVLPESR